VQRKIRNGVQVQGQGEWPSAGGQVCTDPKTRGQAECGAGGGDYEFIAASPHYTIVRGIRISENDVRRPGTVRKISRAPINECVDFACPCLVGVTPFPYFSMYLLYLHVFLGWLVFGDQNL